MSRVDAPPPPPAPVADASPARRPGPRAAGAVTAGPIRSTLFYLALPVLAESILNTLVGIFDTWLAGRISAVATAAVGLAAYVAWLATMLAMMVGTGTTAVVARYVGSGRFGRANWYANQSIALSVIVGAAVLAGLYCAAPWLAAYSNMTGQAYDIAVHYLRTEAFGNMFMAVTIAGCAALRGAGNMRAPMMLYALMNAINITASCFFVFSLEVGVRGIVYGTVIARVCGAVALVWILVRGHAGLFLRWREMRLVWDYVRRILRIGVPAAADGVIMWANHFAFLAIVTRVLPGILGQASFAAHIIAVRVEALTYLPATAWGAAAATMIGQALGAGDGKRAMRVGHEAVLQCGVLAFTMAILFYLNADGIYEVMSIDPVVRAAGAEPFRLLALLQPLLAVGIVYIWGMRGAGDTRFPMLISLMGVPIRLSLGYYFGIVQGWGLLGAWMGMFGDMVWRPIAATGRYLGGKWAGTKV